MRERMAQPQQKCGSYLEQRKYWESVLLQEQMEQIHFLEGSMNEEQRIEYLEENGIRQEAAAAYAAIMKLEVPVDRYLKITDAVGFLLSVKTDGDLIVRYLQENQILLILCLNKKLTTPVLEWFSGLQKELEAAVGIRSFVIVSAPFTHFTDLPEIYSAAQKLQKYLWIGGYGSCVDEADIKDRIYIRTAVDREKIFYFILQKDMEAARQYVEELFTGNTHEEIDAEVFYQRAIQLALFLEEIRTEYNLPREGRTLSDIVGSIGRAEDLLSVKVLLLSEIANIISWINTQNMQYTPVVRQIISEVKNNYSENMNLKTLAGKFHMNSSYLGQIFQKEVGCPFSQYLNLIRNQFAKELILTTNMKISDIAKEVGFTGTSYFYRKFKQTYGVSPSVMREIKK